MQPKEEVQNSSRCSLGHAHHQMGCNKTDPQPTAISAETPTLASRKMMPNTVQPAGRERRMATCVGTIRSRSEKPRACPRPKSKIRKCLLQQYARGECGGSEERSGASFCWCRQMSLGQSAPRCLAASHHLPEVVWVPTAGPKADVDELAGVGGVLLESALLAVGDHLRAKRFSAKRSARRFVVGARGWILSED